MKSISVTSAFEIHARLISSEDRVRVHDPGPRTVIDAGDPGLDRAGCPHGDGHVRAAGDRRVDGVVAVVGRAIRTRTGAFTPSRRRACFTASPTRRFAPRGDPQEPLRSRCATTKGACPAVESAAISTFRSRGPGCSRTRRPGLGVAVDLDDRVVHVDERVPDARSRLVASGNGAWTGGVSPARRDSASRNRAATASSCRTCPKVNAVGTCRASRARTPWRRAGPSRRSAAGPCHRCRRRRRPSRPRARPPSTQTFAPLSVGTPRCSSASWRSPARSASASTGTRPADDTRFGSSNTAEVRVRV